MLTCFYSYFCLYIYIYIYTYRYVCMYKCLGPSLIRVWPYAFDRTLMVCSLASSDSSVGPPSSSSESPAPDDPSAQAARLRVVEEQANRFRKNRFEWFRRRVVTILCEQAMEDCQRALEASDRQLMVRLSSFRRRCQGRTAENVVEFTLPLLDVVAAQHLHQDATTVLSLLDSPEPPNDRSWILSDQVGRVGDPQRHRVEQYCPGYVRQQPRPWLSAPCSMLGDASTGTSMVPRQGWGSTRARGGHHGREAGTRQWVAGPDKHRPTIDVRWAALVPSPGTVWLWLLNRILMIRPVA